jgi:hypothetical protein
VQGAVLSSPSNAKLPEQVCPDRAAAEMCLAERKGEFASLGPVGETFEQLTGGDISYGRDVLEVRVDALYFFRASALVNLLPYNVSLLLFEQHRNRSR